VSLNKLHASIAPFALLVASSASAQTQDETVEIVSAAEIPNPAPNPGGAASFIDYDGDRAIVGYRHADDNGANSGAAYVYSRPMGTWAREQRIVATPASGNDAGDGFGYSVAISGDTVAIGAAGDDTGSVYIYVRTATSGWQFQQKLTPSNGATNDFFGTSVALEGDTVVVGAYSHGSTGGAYVFTRSGTTWTELQMLTATAGVPSRLSSLGWDVDISGDTIAVGAPFYNGDWGAAYVFTNSMGTWSQATELLPSNATAGDFFGWAVAAVPGRALVGSWMRTAGEGIMAYVYTDNGGTWSEAQLPPTGGHLFYGYDVSFDTANRAWVGAYGSGGRAGAIVGFDFENGAWTQRFNLTRTSGANQLGFTIASVNGTVVGASRDATAMYVYDLSAPPITPISVTSFTDVVATDGDCSLREAIINANTNSDTTGGDCLAGEGTDDVIRVPAGTYSLSIAGIDEDDGATGDLDITEAVTITGEGASTIIDGGRIDRVLHLRAENVTVSDLMIQNGYAQGAGTCMDNSPSNSRDGGGVYLEGWGNATLSRVRVTGNEAVCSGGGIAGENHHGLGGVAVVVDGNTAGHDGGGLHLHRVSHDSLPDRRLYSWTISGNSAVQHGGGIVHSSGCCILLLEGATITDNTAGGSGGGTYQYGFGMEFIGSIVAGNTAMDTTTPECGGGSVGFFYSVVGTNGSDGGCSNIQVGTVVGAQTTATIIEPTLTTTVGGAMYHGLVGGSPAIDLLPTNAMGVYGTRCGQPGLHDVDAFGQPRPFGASCDAGSFELQTVLNTPPVALCSGSSMCASAGMCVLANASVDNGSNDPDMGMVTITETPMGPYSIGTTTVTLTIDDGEDSAMCEAAVTVTDCEGPAVGCSSESAECTGNLSAQVQLTFGATDLCGTVASMNTPAGTTFSLGTTTVAYSATDDSGNMSSCTATVTVVDSAAPTLTVPMDVSVEAQGPGGTDATEATIAAFLSGATAADTCDPAPSLSDDAPSRFPLGETTVTFTAMDTAQNDATDTGAVTVVDTTAPTTTFVGDDTDNDGRPNTFTLTATDTASGVAEIRYNFDSAADVAYTGEVTVPADPTGVSFWAVDTAGNRETTQTLLLPQSPAPDAGMPMADAGMPMADAGMGSDDAGMAVADAGMGASDAGVGGPDAATGSVSGSQPMDLTVTPGTNGVTMAVVRARISEAKLAFRKLILGLGGTGNYAAHVDQIRIVFDADESGDESAGDTRLFSGAIIGAQPRLTLAGPGTVKLLQQLDNDGLYQFLVVFDFAPVSAPSAVVPPVTPPAPPSVPPLFFAALLMVLAIAVTRTRWRMLAPAMVVAAAVACSDDPVLTDGTFQVVVEALDVSAEDGRAIGVTGLPIEGRVVTLDL